MSGRQSPNQKANNVGTHIWYSRLQRPARQGKVTCFFPIGGTNCVRQCRKTHRRPFSSRRLKWVQSPQFVFTKITMRFPSPFHWPFTHSLIQNNEFRATMTIVPQIEGMPISASRRTECACCCCVATKTVTCKVGTLQEDYASIIMARMIKTTTTSDEAQSVAIKS